LLQLGKTGFLGSLTLKSLHLSPRSRRGSLRLDSRTSSLVLLSLGMYHMVASANYGSIVSGRVSSFVEKSFASRIGSSGRSFGGPAATEETLLLGVDRTGGSAVCAARRDGRAAAEDAG